MGNSQDASKRVSTFPDVKTGSIASESTESVIEKRHQHKSIHLLNSGLTLWFIAANMITSRTHI